VITFSAEAVVGSTGATMQNPADETGNGMYFNPRPTANSTGVPDDRRQLAGVLTD